MLCPWVPGQGPPGPGPRPLVFRAGRPCGDILPHMCLLEMTTKQHSPSKPVKPPGSVSQSCLITSSARTRNTEGCDWTIDRGATPEHIVLCLQRVSRSPHPSRPLPQLDSEAGLGWAGSHRRPGTLSEMGCIVDFLQGRCTQALQRRGDRPLHHRDWEAVPDIGPQKNQRVSWRNNSSALGLQGPQGQPRENTRPPRDSPPKPSPPSHPPGQPLHLCYKEERLMLRSWKKQRQGAKACLTN